MNELIYIGIAIACGIIVFILIMKRFGSDCIP